jgi:hypothetical protein
MPNVAAQTGIVSVARFGWIPGNLRDLSKGIFCDDVSEFEYMASHAVGSMRSMRNTWTIQIR